MKKRLIAVVSATAMLMAGFTGCTKKDGTSSSADKKDVVRVCQVKVEIDGPLKDFAKTYEEKTGVHVEIESIGGGADYAGTLKGYKAAGNMPDIFVVEGPGTYRTWKNDMAQLDDEVWVDDTVSEFRADGHVWGFPYAVEGYGLAYNADILKQAGIDPASLTTIDAYKAAFEKLEGMKSQLGINSVVSMAASVSAGMTWVTGNHNFGAYLANGLETSDTTVIDDLLNGKVNKARLTEFAEYVKLLFDYSDETILLTGNYDQQVGAFADGKAVFCHQGNWIDPNLEQLGVTFKMGYAPHAFSHEVMDGVLVDAPSWWGVYNEGNVSGAKDFLKAFAMEDYGRDARINKMHLISPYSSDTLKPTTPLSASLQDWIAQGKTYAWHWDEMPDGFGMDTLGPIYELLAQGSITTDQFVDMITDSVSEIPNM